MFNFLRLGMSVTRPYFLSSSILLPPLVNSYFSPIHFVILDVCLHQVFPDVLVGVWGGSNADNSVSHLPYFPRSPQVSSLSDWLARMEEAKILLQMINN